MPRLVFFLMPMMVACVAGQAPAKSASKQKAAKPAATAIPAGAVEVEPYLFRHADKDGKVWLYRKTPFGVSKTSEQAQQDMDRAQAQAAANASKVRVTDNGGTVKFERGTPMGNQSWEKRKDELTPEEKGWVADNARQAVARPGK